MVKKQLPRTLKKKSRRPAKRAGRTLLAERLEDRIVLTTVSWAIDGNGFWDVGSNWSTGTVPQTGDDVVLDRAAGNFTITFRSGTSAVNRVTGAERLVISGGALDVAGEIQMGNGLALSGGTLKHATILPGVVAPGFDILDDGILDRVTLGTNTTLREGAQVTVLNGLTLNNSTLRLEYVNASAFDILRVGLNFNGGAQTLGGVGTVQLFNGATNSSGEDIVRVRPTAGGSLTIGPGISVRDTAGSRISTLGDPSLPLLIQGTVVASGQSLHVNGSSVTNTGTLQTATGELDVNNLRNQGQVVVPSGSLRLRGSWTNASTINQSGGAIHLGGAFSVENMGTFFGTAGTVNIFGTLSDPGATLVIDANRTWQLDGGTVRGLTIDGAAGTLFQVTSADGVLDGVTLATNTTLREGAQVTVLNSLMLDTSILRLEYVNLSAFDVLRVGLNFSGGAQTLGGTGTVQLFNGVINSSGEDIVRVRPTNGGSLTIGPRITVLDGLNSQVATLGDPSLPLFIQGTVFAQSAGQTLRTMRLTGSTVTNTGTLQSLTGELDINNLMNLGEILVSGGGLRLRGDWSNASNIEQTGGTVHLGGTFTVADLGPFAGSAGTVSIFGTLSDPGATLSIDADRTWQLSGGTIAGVTIGGGPGTQFELTSSDGTLNGVTLSVAATLREGAQVTVLNGLTLDNSTLRLEYPNTSAFDSLRVGLNFSGGAQTLGGVGTVQLFNGVTNSGGEDIVRVRPTSGGSLTIGPGISIGDTPGVGLTTLGDPSLPLTIQGTVVAQSSGQALRLTGSTITNTGTLRTSTGGTLDINQALAVNASGLLAGLGSGSINVSGNLTGDTRNADLYNPRGTVRLDGTGTPAAPQRLEAMGRDLGSNASGFTRNFVYGTLTLANNTYVRLADLADNATGAEPEAVYTNFLMVPAGTTLDLNGLHLYARAVQINGSVIGGSVIQTADSGPLAFGAPTPGAIAVPDELDEWLFFGRGGRSVTLVVNPGLTGLLTPLPPRLNFASVELVGPQGNVLATGSSSVMGGVVTLTNVVLPVDGNYRVHVRGRQASNTGGYFVTLWDSTVDQSPLSLGQRHIGVIESPFSIDRWVFSATAGQQVRFDLLNSVTPGLAFTLTGPSGFVGFTGLTNDSDLVNLTASGAYTLTAVGGPGQTGAYSFELLETTRIDLTLGVPYAGAFAGSGQAQLFRVDVPESSPLQVTLDDSSASNRHEVYLKFGVPPTRADFQFRHAEPAADQQVLAPQAAAGTWYILVYSAVATPNNFTLTARASDILLNTVTPEHHGNAADAVLTLTGAGFERTTTVELVATDGSAYSAASVESGLHTQITARFAAGAVPIGTYAVRVRRADGATAVLPNAFRIEAGGEAHFESEMILPTAVGRQSSATIFVEYANTGTVAMPAPLLILRATDRAILQGPVYGAANGGSAPGPRAIVRETVLDSVQLLASGATPGVLQPGERLRVPVYFSGLAQPWDFSDTSVDFSLTAVEQDDESEFDWEAQKNALRPDFISAAAWDVIYANLESQVGPTWGDYVRVLNENARYLGNLGQNVVDAGQLGGFELQQAIGIDVLDSVAASVDIQVPAPGLPITFSRTFSPSIVARNDQGPLGYGWSSSDGWQSTLFVDPDDGSINISGATCGCAVARPRGTQRRFQPDSRRPGRYVGGPGDHATLTALGFGAFQLVEANGLVTRFRNDGRVDYVQDTNGNRVTATWTGELLTRLTHSAGQFLQINYNAAGRIESLLDSTGRSASYTYDAANEHLLTATGIDGQTTHYGYSQTADAARKHALVEVQSPDGTHRFVTYDVRGRLESMARDGNAERLTFTYDTAGRVMLTDANSGTIVYFIDHRGAAAAYEDPLGNRTIIAYDDDHNLARLINAIGQEYAFAYDARGNMLRSSDPLGQVTMFTYTTDFNRLASVTDARGNPMRYGYDNRGNLTAITYANGSVERYAVDEQGNLDTYSNRRGQVVDSRFDVNGRLERQDLPDGTFREFHYNSRGNLEQAIAPEGVTQFQYADPLNPDLPTKISYPNGTFLAYTYENGRRTGLIHPDGYTVKYIYDAVGRLEFLRDGGDNLIVQYQHDSAGRLSRRINGNETFTEYDYDAAGWVEHLINHAPDGLINSRFDYVYDPLGRRTQMSTLEGVWDYTYDDIGQLTHAAFTSNDPSQIPHQDLEYVYDAVGNRVRTVINGVMAEYTTNSLNQYTRVGLSQYSYDLDGNLVARTEAGLTETFTYDPVSRLVGVETPLKNWAYEYDVLGNRSATTENGLRTEYLVDPSGLGDVVSEHGTMGVTARYTHAFGILINRIASGSSSYFDFDALGSTVGLTGAAGGYVNRYSYRPFGERLISSETIPNPFAYVGQLGVMQEGSGLEFMRARLYATFEGRFIAQDPIGLAGRQINMNAYAGNDPISAVDPSGLDDSIAPIGSYCKTAFGAAGGAIGAYAGGIPGWIVGKLVGGGVGYLVCPDGDHKSLPSYAIDVPWNYYPPSGSIRQDIGSTWWSVTPELGKPVILEPRYPESDPPIATSIFTPRDPNQKIGPRGFGAPSFIPQSSLLSYRIDFENEADATVPAQRVVVTDQLDTYLDWNTFQFTEVGFGDLRLAIPAGSQYLFTTVSVVIDGKTIEVDIELNVNVLTGLVTAVFQSIDPVTGLPPDVFTGFLPPEDGTGRGQGYLTYIVDPDAGLPTGTQIRNVAVITFVGSQPIATNQVDPHDPSLGTDPNKEAFNTIDAGTPTSAVSPLPVEVVGAGVTVSWAGQGDAGGSGIRDYDIYVSKDGKAFILWLDDTTDTSAVFTGLVNHSYAFYSIATDNVGHVELPPVSPDAVVRLIPANTPPTANAGGQYEVLEGGGISLSGLLSTDAEQAVGTLVFNWDLDGDGEFDDATGSSPAFSAAGLDGPNMVTVGLRVTDAGGLTSTATAQVQIKNALPVVNSGLDRNNVPRGSIINFGGSFTDAGLLATHTIVWDFGDGQTATGTLTPTHAFGAVGTYLVTLTVTDDDGGVGSDTLTVMVVSAENRPPVLSPIPNQPLAPGATHTVALSAVDPDHDPLSFSAVVVRLEVLAKQLDDTFKLDTTGNYSTNWGGQGEKWLRGMGNIWYFIKPNGDFYRWDNGPTATGERIAQLNSQYHADPSLLYNAPNPSRIPGPTVQFTGSTLLLTIPATYSREFRVEVKASDPAGAFDTKMFTVNGPSSSAAVTSNRPPVLSEIADQTLIPGQPLSISLSAIDPDHDLLSFTAQVIRLEDRAYELRQSLGFTSNGNLYLNWGGRGEKWFQGMGGFWYFILPNGGLYRWNNSSEAAGAFVAQFDERFHSNPELLFHAPPPSSIPGPAVSVSGATLTIAAPTGYTSDFEVRVTATDSLGASDSKTFKVTVPSAQPVFSELNAESRVDESWLDELASSVATSSKQKLRKSDEVFAEW